MSVDLRSLSKALISVIENASASLPCVAISLRGRMIPYFRSMNTFNTDPVGRLHQENYA